MASLVAPVVNGEVQNNRVDEKDKVQKKDNSNLDKQAFLQLLVAEMQNQDPLEPTTNTEYISQLATFSSLEEMQNMRTSMDMYRANALVGKEVYVMTNNGATGEVSYEHGNVDYVTFENGKVYVNINGSNYSIEDVDSVYDEKYVNASQKAEEWIKDLNALPSLAMFSLADEKKLLDLVERADKMSDYEISFLSSEVQDKLKSYIERYNVLKKAQDEKDQAASQNGQSQGTVDKTEGSQSGSSQSGSTGQTGTTQTENTTPAETTNPTE